MEIQPEFVLFIPVIVATVEAVKRSLAPADRYVPALAVLFGLVVGFGFAGFSFASALQGVLVGLSAIGLYSGAKNSLR